MREPGSGGPRRARDGRGAGEAGGGERPPEAQARDRALRLLARREKSRAGLSRMLRRAGYSPGVAGEALDQLEREGLVDDLRFCRLYLGQQSRMRPRAPRLLRHDLRREGVAPEVIERAMAEMAEDLEEEVLARSAARRKLRTAAGDVQRLRRLLEARGFGPAACESALRSVLPLQDAQGEGAATGGSAARPRGRARQGGVRSSHTRSRHDSSNDRKGSAR